MTDLLDDAAAVLLFGILNAILIARIGSSQPTSGGPHHLEDPQVGVRALANLVRPGGELRLYVYHTLGDEPWWKRGLFGAVTGVRQITTRLPYPAVHAISWLVAAVASVLFLWPRRLQAVSLGRPAHTPPATRALRRCAVLDGRIGAVRSAGGALEGRFSRDEVEAWLRDVGFEIVAILPGLGWRAIGRRPPTGDIL